VSSFGLFTGLPLWAIVQRAVAFLALWLILVGGPDPSDRPAGIIALVAATWVSLRLLPPGAARPSPIAIACLVLRCLRQSIVAGVDVAWRALDPRLPLRPGFVTHSALLPPGPALNAFCALTSLAPGTLPAGLNDSGAIVVHCLDVGQPVASHLVADEKLFMRALGRGRDDG
jgi:multicomponent Na+:H+ antiporter subunit E